MIPKVLKKKEFRFCLIQNKSKAPFEKAWQKNSYVFDDSKLQAHLSKGGNYGVIGGYGKLRILDIDDKSKVEEFKEKFKDTFMVKTGSGGLHIYLLTDYNKNHVLKNDLGEFRAKNYQCVGAGSTHPNGKKYTLLNNNLIKRISKEEIKKILKPYLREEVTDTTQSEGTDESRSGIEFGEVCRLIERGYSKKKIFERMNAFEKWKNAGDKYRNHTYTKALKTISKYGKSSIKNPQKIRLMTFKDYEKLKKDTNFLVEDFIYPKTITMFYSPPGQFKSLLAMYLGMSVASGKEWLNFNTKKYPVLFFDGENNDQIIKERLEKIYAGQRQFKRKKIPLFITKDGILMDTKKRIVVETLQQIEEIIKEKEIKLIVFDTMHRFAFYDENSADDINTLYRSVFQRLRNEFDVSIMFLHHTNKQNRFRGSGDFLGMVDTSYKILRSKGKDRFTLYCEKSRAGEIEKVMGEIDFGEDYIKFLRLNEDQEEEKEITKIKEITDEIRQLFTPGKEMARRHVIEELEIKGIKFGSKKTISRSLRFLKENGYLEYNEKTRKYHKPGY